MGRKTGALGEAALRYAERGLAVFPVKPKGKAPLTKNGFKNATTDPEKIRRLWAKHPRANIGFVPGSGGLILLDIDAGGEKAARAAGLLDIETLKVRSGGGGVHVLFRKPEDTEISNILDLKDLGVDVLRADGGYAIGPPSIHPSGQQYEWINPGAEPAVCPDWLWERLQAPTPSRNGGKRAAGAGKVAKGGRNNHLASRAGALRAMGLDGESLRRALLALNEAECDPPLSEVEVEGVLRSAEKWKRGESASDMIDRINAEFALVPGAKMPILWENPPQGRWVLLTRAEFADYLAKWPPVMVDGKAVQAATAWLRSPRRREATIVFEPGGTHTPGAFNLFRGWSVEPSAEGECGLFLDHLRDNVAGGDRELYEWVVGWFAQIFQRPDRKLGTSLVLRGRQGTGKSIVGNVIGRLMKDYYRSVSDPSLITGRFNAHLEHLLLLQPEEAFWAGDDAAEGRLKDLITSETHEIQRKFFDSIPVANHVRLFITSNAGWVVPAGLEERRFAVLDMGEGWMQDTRRFGAMVRQLEEENGYAALLDFLLKWAVDEERLRHVPRTAALAEQKLHTLTIDQEWLYNILDEGMLPSDNDGSGECLKSFLHDHYTEYTRKIGRRTKSTKTQLGIFLRSAVPGLSDARPARAGERVKVYRFPAPGECRAAFGRDLGIEWPEGEEWRPWDEPF